MKIGFGTDIGVCAFGRNAREFGLMVQNGMTPMQAIQAATVADADLLGLGDKLGSVKSGRLADLIAVRGDPLADIRRARGRALRDEAGRDLQARLSRVPSQR